MAYQNLLDEWRFISTINKGEKPCYNDKTKINVSEWFVTWRRRYKGEKGEKGVLYMQNLLENTNKYLELYKDGNKLLLEVLNSSIIGINNLVYTYQMEEQEHVSKDYQ